jgi:hypothetical protein
LLGQRLKVLPIAIGIHPQSLLMSEFGNEEKKISQYSSQTNGALAEWINIMRPD